MYSNNAIIEISMLVRNKWHANHVYLSLRAGANFNENL